MKRASQYWLASLIVLGGCSVDLGKLRAPDAQRSGVAADAAGDLPPSGLDSPTGDGDAHPAVPDAPNTTGDAPGPIDAAPETVGDVERPVDEGEEGEAGGIFDAIEDTTAQGRDAMFEDVPAPLPDGSQSALDLAPPEADGPEGDASSERPSTNDDAPAAPDLAPSLDVGGDTPGQGNGTACSSSGQCSSGFCVGNPGTCCSQACTSACYQPNQCMTGACVPTNGAITCGSQDAVCGLVVNDLMNAREWSLRSEIQVGDQALGSDPYLLSAVPLEVAGFPWIRPSRSSKTTTANPLVTFTLSAPADVYVGVDTRVAIPSWLSSWTDSGATLSYLSTSSTGPPTTVTQRLLKATFAAGSVALGPLGCASTANCSMYLTVIKFVDQPSGAAASVCQ